MRRGFLLIASLLLCLVLLALGMGLLGSRSRQYDASRAAGKAAQARALAEAGLEDTRVKLMKDFDFPPLGADDQALFGYRETVADIGGAEVLGGYVVTVDTTHKAPPYYVLVISSLGYVGSPENPEAMRKLSAEVDICEVNRKTGTAPNPNLLQVINFRDEGSL